MKCAAPKGLSKYTTVKVRGNIMELWLLTSANLAANQTTKVHIVTLTYTEPDSPVPVNPALGSSLPWTCDYANVSD